MPNTMRKSWVIFKKNRETGKFCQFAECQDISCIFLLWKSLTTTKNFEHSKISNREIILHPTAWKPKLKATWKTNNLNQRLNETQANFY